MANRRAFRHTDGAEANIDTDDFVSYSNVNTPFASLPADVQTAAAALSASADWRMGTIKKGNLTESYWVTLGITGIGEPFV